MNTEHIVTIRVRPIMVPRSMQVTALLVLAKMQDTTQCTASWLL